MEKNYDFVVIGSGIAGLFFAQKVASLMPKCRVAVITKKDEAESNTNYAQGGIATVMSGTDSFDAHVADTLNAGAGLCNRRVVEDIVRNGPAVINKLTTIGVEFTRTRSGFDLGREGGHSANRVVHAADLTGQEIERALLDACHKRKNVHIYKDTIALELITYIHQGRRRCGGVYTFTRERRIFHTFFAPVIMLATGGIGQVYYNTTNPDIATGDGIAMAFRAGARVANMEFIQFHPTTLYDPGRRPFLISEAVRGEGAILTDSSGKRFMQRYHPQRELAARDIVARAIDAELKRSGDECVYLDISHKKPSFIKRRFPNIYRECLDRGYDITKQPIPVVPSAHYNCGGILANLYGQTDIEGLYVCGESACTGMHGANRLASNSLLEAVVMSDYAADSAAAFHKNNKFPEIPPADEWLHSSIKRQKEKILIFHDRFLLKKLMFDFVGIVRTVDRLNMARDRIRVILKGINSYFLQRPASYNVVELRNIALTASLIIRCAVKRKESRGLHYILDYPEKDDKHWKKNTVIKPPEYIPARRKNG
jgi:L-aspartate oxidase